MEDIIGDLLAHPAASVCEPAEARDIAEVAEAMGAKLPAFVIRLWSVSDGVDFESLHCHIPGTAEVMQLIDGKEWADYASSGWVPILDDHESNSLAVCVRPPLAFRVVHLPHDDGPRLIYRDAESAYREMLVQVNQKKSPDSYLFESPGDYAPATSRTEEDRNAGKALLAGTHLNHKWNFAAQLIDAADLSEWKRLLETDHFVRRDAKSRMKKMNDPAIQQLLAADQVAFDEFVSLVARETSRAGLKVGQRHDDCLQIGEKWMQMESFFHRRGITNAIPRMLDWFRDLIAGRNPHDREGHFMED